LARCTVHADLGSKATTAMQLYAGASGAVASLSGDVSQDPLGNPRGRYDEHNSKFSLSMKQKFNQLVGERNHF
jgi:hypothetical protein